MMTRRSILATLLVMMFLTSMSPSTYAYKGYQLSRGPVEDFSLLDQDGEIVNLSDSRGDVVIVAFIFTRCPDVCPIITQLLRSVELGLGEDYQEHVSIISITVDPDHDTQERLKDYTELHNVDWPHLTGDIAQLEKAWASFGIVVQKNVIEAHVGDINGHQAEDPTVIVVNKSGISQELMYTPNAWTVTNMVAEASNWTINATSDPQYGHNIIGLNGVDLIWEDCSCYWRLMTYNSSSEMWEESQFGVDSLEYPESKNIAYIPSTSDISHIPIPPNNASSVTLVNSDNSTETQLVNLTAWNLTRGAIESEGLNFSYTKDSNELILESISNESGLDEDNWFWQLHEWDENSSSWNDIYLSPDMVQNPGYLAWAPNNTLDSEIPIPGIFVEEAEEVCDGHGWEMGSGSSKHCMCDEGYEWPEETMLSCIPVDVEEEYNVGHSTTTFILDTQRKPVVAWTGDSWNAQEFISDVESVIESEGLVDTDSSKIPGFMILSGVVAISLAAIMINSKKGLKRDKSIK